MSVLVGNDTRLIVQGFTGSEGTFHAEQMIEYGTNVVGGVTPGKGGQTHLDRPVFNTVADAVEHANANTSIIFVPPAFAGDAITEAAFAGIKVIICITEGIPVKDMILAKQVVKSRGATLVGPNCPGVITPGEAKVGIMPGSIFTKGTVKEHVTKPVVAFIAGSTAPPGRRMGHAGAIISGGKGTAQEKKKALSEAGITVVDSPAEIGETLKRMLENA